jgi:hypothetical protein
LDNGQTRDFLEVARIGGQHGEAERQGRRTNQQVAERDDHSYAPLLAVEHARKQRRLLGVRVHREVRQEFLEKDSRRKRIAGVCAR